MDTRELAEVARLHILWAGGHERGRQAQHRIPGSISFCDMSKSDFKFYPSHDYRSKQEEVEPKEGCRMLGDGEVIKKGDFVRRDGESWEVAFGLIGVTTGTDCFCDYKACRPIEVKPKEGCRMLGDDEVIKKGDKFWHNGHGVACCTTIGETPHAIKAPVCRPIEVKPKEGCRMLEHNIPPKEGDYVSFDDGYIWNLSNNHNNPIPRQASGCHYCRPIEVKPKEGCRMLEEEEKVKDGDWMTNGHHNWILLEDVLNYKQHSTYHYCRPIEPEVIPWKLDEMPLGGEVRRKDDTKQRCLILGITPNGNVRLGNGHAVTPAGLAKNYEWEKIMHSDDWRPCGTVKED